MFADSIQFGLGSRQILWSCFQILVSAWNNHRVNLIILKFSFFLKFCCITKKDCFKIHNLSVGSRQILRGFYKKV